MKKLLCVLLTVMMLLALGGCATKTLHCDKCGKEVQVEASSNMEEDWIIFCAECDATFDYE